jgi:hypothetical protein
MGLPEGSLLGKLEMHPAVKIVPRAKPRTPASKLNSLEVVQSQRDQAITQLQKARADLDTANALLDAARTKITALETLTVREFLSRKVWQWATRLEREATCPSKG